MMDSKYGYIFEPGDLDVRRARKPYDCEGADDCGTTILVGDVYLAEKDEMFEKERKVCISCALNEGLVTKGGQLDEDEFYGTFDTPGRL
jgi:hypothetical protein